MTDEPHGSDFDVVPAVAEAPPNRFTRVLAALDHPLAIGFLATIGVLGALVLGSAIGSISTILVYIVLAMFLALGLDPIVRMLERHKVKRGLGIAIVFCGFALVAVAFFVFVLPPVIAQVVQLVEAIPEGVENIPQSDWFAQLTPDGQAAVLAGMGQLADWISAPSTIAMLGGGVLAVGVGFVAGISASFIVIALTLYFLASLSAAKQALYALAPARSRIRLEDLTERITGSVGSALIGSVILSSLNAAAVFILHVAIGLPFPALMAVIAFVITLVPLFGSVIFWIFASIIALFSSPTQALIFFVAYLIYIQLESYVISPRVMNKAIAIPAALVLIGALAGGALAGIVGVLVALPVMASILLIIREVVVPRQNLKV
ncbi:AI-2E family transporter [Microbacterium sp. B35-04]|uniref:AI-2E family transporter n=1 Tax=unclassified Microbacterium TaxID=2609290 RepID=UPI0013D3E9E4|nr:MULTISPECIES: AI-2E family transporter [unclassified Microbacterium]KAF2411721.1 AI-2E family transporter [Microbacterium sp. B35-04]KAF2420842.1 AI-2E family transporter [Microbacterium sp. B35-30]